MHGPRRTTLTFSPYPVTAHLLRNGSLRCSRLYRAISNGPDSEPSRGRWRQHVTPPQLPQRRHMAGPGINEQADGIQYPSFRDVLSISSGRGRGQRGEICPFGRRGRSRGSRKLMVSHKRPRGLHYIHSPLVSSVGVIGRGLC